MSRGFVKEGDQEEIPMVPPRAYLPAGVTNYVTQAGMNALLAEKQRYMAEKEQADTTNENEKRIALNYINAKLLLLNNRIAEARIVDLSRQPANEIRFGASIRLKIQGTDTIQTMQIVGVDEADVSKGKISFISPLAKLLMNKKKGDTVVLKLVKEDRIYEILDFNYK